MKASTQSEELVPRSLREIVQKKFLDEVIGTTGIYGNFHDKIKAIHRMLEFSKLEGSCYGRSFHKGDFVRADNV
jgi:hypothetical protein